jgi:hypothetical protein
MTSPGPLTDADREIIARARDLAAAHGDAAIRKVTAAPESTVSAMVYSDALGVAQYLLGEVVAIAERLAGEDAPAAREDGSDASPA